MNPEINNTGIFGKLPAYGDFIYRDLPADFMSVWDQWLQGYIGTSREQLADAWLDIYLTSPVWRFALSEGVIDNNAWAGIIIPSVDRVGRYFPFSIATRLPSHTNVTDFMCARPNWFQTMEAVALQALDGELDIEELIEELNDSNPRVNQKYLRACALQNTSKIVLGHEGVDSSVSTALPQLADALLLKNLQSYSVWSTNGSEHIAPCLFFSAGLPALSGITAMMDGRWQERQWQQPFVLKQ